MGDNKSNKIIFGMVEVFCSLDLNDFCFMDHILSNFNYVSEHIQADFSKCSGLFLYLFYTNGLISVFTFPPKGFPRHLWCNVSLWCNLPVGWLPRLFRYIDCLCKSEQSLQTLSSSNSICAKGLFSHFCSGLLLSADSLFSFLLWVR